MTSINFSFCKRVALALVLTLSLGVLGIVISPRSASATSHPTAGRTLRLVPVFAEPGGQAVVSVELDSLGDEVALTFSVNFDPTKLNTPVVTLGSGAPAGTALTINPNQVASGRIGFLLDSANPFAISPPARQLVSIKFNVAPGAPAGPSPVTFGSTPAPRSTSDSFGILVPTTYEDGSVTIASSTPQAVELTGRVVTPSGNGLRNANVTLTDPENNRRIIPTGSMGYYSFGDVAVGKTYVITVTSRQYRFETRTVALGSTGSVVDFVALD